MNHPGFRGGSSGIMGPPRGLDGYVTYSSLPQLLLGEYARSTPGQVCVPGLMHPLRGGAKDVERDKKQPQTNGG